MDNGQVHNPFSGQLGVVSLKGNFFYFLFLKLFILYWILANWASLVAQKVKNLPAMQETQVQPLGREDPLEKEIATHSSILAWRIP